MVWNILGLKVSTPVLKWNGDFPHFLNFVILPLRFWNEGRLLPLLCEVPLAVLTLNQRITLPMHFYPYFILIVVFLHLFLDQQFDNFDT
jgi:hypothetical protein